MSGVYRCCGELSVVLCDVSRWSFIVVVVTVVLDVVQTGQPGLVTELSTAYLALLWTFRLD